MNEFRKNILKVNQTRIHKVKNSFGVQDAYRYIKRNKQFCLEYPITTHQFYRIIRTLNKYLAEQLSLGIDITLPCKLGVLELRKKPVKIKFENNKLVTNLPIDWDNTLKLWQEDKEAYNNKTLIRMEENQIFKIYYNKSKANYNNKQFYQFKVNREIKKKLKHNIKEEGLDAFKLYD